MRGPRPGRRARGASLLEAVVATVVAAVVLTPLTWLVRSATGSAGDVETETRSDAQCRRALGRAGDLLRDAGFDTASLVPVAPAWTDDAAFDVATAIDPATGVLTWMPVRLRWVRDAADPDNGLDDDGDGTADEGDLVLTLDEGGPGERTTVLAGGVPELLEGETANGSDDNGNGLVDERGFSMTRTGRLVTVRLTIRRTTPAGRTTTQTGDLAVRVRN